MTDKNGNFYAITSADMADIVEAMNTIIKGLNDETAYFENWIDIVPDEASREDFEDIAKDKELLSDVVARFKHVINKFVD